MIGKQYGNLKITGKLGEGGMGVVYEAEDTELDRKVALKVLPAGLAEHPDRLKRFRREAKAIAALNHPNIITIYGVVEAEGQRFLIMEKIEGDTLAHKIQAGSLSLSEIFDIAISMAEALSAAHIKGIVHRDVKPSNVMVTETGHVKMLDFGLAKVSAETGVSGESPTQLLTKETPLTGEGVIMGTAPYMSPEQLQGKPLDGRTDIFSLGTVIYEMVTGKRPFEGDTGIALASSILKDTPRWVSDVRTELPKHLGRIVQQCLEKSPDDRFQTAKDVRNQLVALKRETFSEISRPQELPAAPASRAKWVIAAIAVALLLGLGGMLFRSASEAPEVADTGTATVRKIVVLPFENLGEPDDEYFADGMTEEITSRLAALKGLSVISRTSAMRYKDSRPTIKQIGEELGVEYVLEGTVRWQHASDGPSRVRVTPQLIRVSEDSHLWAERYDAVLADVFEVQSDIAVKVSKQLGVALLEPERLLLESRPTANLEAYDSFLRGNDYYNRGTELISAEEMGIALGQYKEAIRQDPEFALAHARLATVHAWFYTTYSDRTATRLSLADDAVQQALKLNHDLPEAHQALGQIYMARDDHHRALAEFETVLESQPSNAQVFADISLTQLELGKWDEAKATMKKASELSPRLGRFTCFVGGFSIGMRDFKDALFFHDRAIKLTPDRACPYFCKANIFLHRDGTTARARAFLEDLPASVGLEESPPINLPWVVIDIIDGKYEDALKRLSSGSSDDYTFDLFYIPKDLLAAGIHRLMGNYDLAEKSYEAARDSLRKGIEKSPEDDRLRGALGIAYAGLGDRDGAIREGELGLELLSGAQGMALGYRLQELAQIHMMIGQHDTAIDYLERILTTPTLFTARFLKADPTWIPLRDNPRFRTLLEVHMPSPV